MPKFSQKKKLDIDFELKYSAFIIGKNVEFGDGIFLPIPKKFDITTKDKFIYVKYIYQTIVSQGCTILNAGTNLTFLIK